MWHPIALKFLKVPEKRKIIGRKNWTQLILTSEQSNGDI